MKGIYLVTDGNLCTKFSLEDTVMQAVKAGVSYVQLREKHASTKDFVEMAVKLKKILSSFNVPLIINDRIDVALASDADGVHIGQTDMPFEMARKLMGNDAIIGLSVETWEDVRQAEKFNVDYLGVSPVYSTPTKTDTKEPWGLKGLSKIRDFSRLPLVAIGGINRFNAEQVLKAGADCLAVVSAICAACDPFEATLRLCKIAKKHTGQNNKKENKK